MKNIIASYPLNRFSTIRLFVLILLFANGAFPFAAYGSETATVTDVIDGDTITVSFGDREERVRLVGIDTPELHGAGAPECYAAEAKEKTKQLVLGKTVTLLPDGPSADRDRYDRLLRYVVVDGIRVNETLVREGYAPAYLAFKFEKKDLYTELESSAKAAHIGVWGASCGNNAVPTPENSSSNQTLIIVIVVGVFVALGLLPRSVLSKVLRSIKK